MDRFFTRCLGGVCIRVSPTRCSGLAVLNRSGSPNHPQHRCDDVRLLGEAGDGRIVRVGGCEPQLRGLGRMQYLHAPGSGDTATATVTVEIRPAGGGEVLDSAVYTFSAENTD